jgi:hypothetical protein
VQTGPERDLKEFLQEIDEGRKYYLAEKGGKVVGGLTAGRGWEQIAQDHRC